MLPMPGAATPRRYLIGKEGFSSHDATQSMPSDRAPIISILKKPLQGKIANSNNPELRHKGYMETLHKMNKFQRAGHILEKMKNDNDQSINFIDEIKAA